VQQEQASTESAPWKFWLASRVATVRSQLEFFTLFTLYLILLQLHLALLFIFLMLYFQLQKQLYTRAGTQNIIELDIRPAGTTRVIGRRRRFR